MHVRGRSGVQLINKSYDKSVPTTAQLVRDLYEAEPRQGALLADEVRVTLDWMAGTQSLRATVEHLEDIMYIGLDIQEWVFSQAMGGWVQNLRVDLETTSYEEVWQMVCKEVERRVGKRVEVQVASRAKATQAVARWIKAVGGRG